MELGLRSRQKALAEYKLRHPVSPDTDVRLEIADGKIRARVGEGRNAETVELDRLLPRRTGNLLEEVKKELNSVIGLGKVKEYVLSLEDHFKVQKMREEAGHKLARTSMHMIFVGNPGTGKTTIARIVAKYLKALGILSTGQLREVTRSDLVGQYVGHTAKLTNEVVQSALGGVLFIDEAYALCRDEHDVFGREAVDALVKAIEDYRDDLVVILAGYKDEMEKFLDTNSGLRSRFPNVIEFEDYTPEEMYEIALVTARSKGYRIAEDCREPLLRLFEKSQIKGRNDSGNGRLVRNVIEQAILEQSKRLLREPGAPMDLLTYDDFGFESFEKFDLEKALAGIVGLENVKEFVRTQYKMLLAEEKRRQAGLQTDTTQTLNMIFTGNSGTGKTTVARVMASMFKEMGLLKRGHLVETDRRSLVSEYVGQTAKKTEEVFRSALGGVLFIDEAYSLAGTGSSADKEAIDTLVKLLEDYRGEIAVILAGYRKEMADFLRANSGLESRFPIRIDFPDYSARELYEIALKMIDTKGFQVTEEARRVLAEQIDILHRTSTAHSGNARMVRNFVETILRNQSARIASSDVAASDLTVILPEDIETTKRRTEEFDLEGALAKIIGLEEVKSFIRGLYARLRLQNERKKMGLPVDQSQTLHMIFKGNPGTGKTMVARIVADVLYHIGIIRTNKLVDTDRAGLVAGYVGQTAIKTTEKVMEAMDGVLFIDEAYSLAQGGENDFGKEAIDTLVKLMDDNRERLVVILAGYSRDMDDFLKVNPGLKSRFPNIIEFADYTLDELLQIAYKFYEDKGYVLSEAAKAKLAQILDEARKEEAFGNGRYVRNVFERSVNNQALRLSSDPDLTREELTVIEAEDLEKV
ncbi:MAG TPA: AAA family ATPase [Paenibacillaceae bacterium]